MLDSLDNETFLPWQVSYLPFDFSGAYACREVKNLTIRYICLFEKSGRLTAKCAVFVDREENAFVIPEVKKDVIYREFCCRKVLSEFAHEYHPVKTSKGVI